MRVQKHSTHGRWSHTDKTIVRQYGREDDGPHFAGAARALLRVGCGPGGQPAAHQVRSDGSVFFAGVRMSGDSCAKIHDEPAVMIPTHRNVA
ncbi:hypothetical protein B0G71_0370 [Paraburkholderia sp. BL27I4N3]|nr:hypothetical protein B0G71_0370 [Paraburkholderia sp. BL27I4N3]RKR44396.1 hypothetical protein B0G82_2001 [Paraburkholderia sp. BL17N1]